MTHISGRDSTIVITSDSLSHSIDVYQSSCPYYLNLSPSLTTWNWNEDCPEPQDRLNEKTINISTNISGDHTSTIPSWLYAITGGSSVIGVAPKTENTDRYNDRVGNIVVAKGVLTKSVVVKQFKKPTVFSVSKQSVSIRKLGVEWEEFSFEITSNVNWNIAVVDAHQNFTNVSQNSGSGNATINVSFNPQVSSFISLQIHITPTEYTDLVSVKSIQVTYQN